MGDCDLAKTYYAKSLELNPGDIGTQLALAIAQIPKVYKSLEDESEFRTNFARQLNHLSAQQHLDTLLAEKNNCATLILLDLPRRK